LCLEGDLVTLNADEIISRCQLFSQVDPVRRNRLAQVSLVRRFAKGIHIFHEGDPCPGVYVVGSGSVRIFKTGPGGKEHVLHMISTGQTFGEVAAIGGFPCPAHAEAIAATTTVLIPYQAFRKAISDDHQLCLEMMSGLSYWVKHLVGLMEDIVLRDAMGRVARFLLDAPAQEDGSVKLPGLKRHIASHLNLTSETFSRTLSRLIEAGLVVELDTNRVELRDRRRLQAASEGLFPQL
jgi:CRP/FNR family transcriptional regulator, dissimilatory nitrate respiration regulator